MKRIILVTPEFVQLKFALIGLILSTTTSLSYPSFAESIFKIVDSGFLAQESSSSQTYFWLDNERIIFTGLSGEFDDLSLSGGAGKRMHTAVYVWNVPNEKITQVTKEGGVHCASNDYVRYVAKNSDGSMIWYKGQLGEERPFAVKKEGTADIEYLEPNLTIGSFSKLDCRDKKQSASSRDEKIIELLPSHGYLYGGARIGKASLENKPYLYFKNENDKGIEMPFKTRESGGGIRYYAFKKAYFIGSSYFDAKAGYGTWPWPSNLSRPVWWLFPSGHVEEIRLRPGLPADTYLLASKAGILIVSHKFSVKNGPSEDGVYLIRNEVTTKLIAGSVAARGGDVSPDGCKLALVHSYFWEAAKKKNTLKVINLCDGEENDHQN